MASVSMRQVEQRPQRNAPIVSRVRDQRGHGQEGLLALQSRAGNQATLLSLAQAKLEVGAAGDRYEQEADRVARDVVARLHPAAGTRVGGDPGIHLRRHMGSPGHDHGIGPEGGALSPSVESAIAAARRGGRPLETGVRARFEEAFGDTDFGAVRLHDGPEANRLNQTVSATAFTVGRDIFFRSAAPDVSTQEGASLLAHELTHTIQQGASPTVSRSAGEAGPLLQRHSSWEHSLLGDAKPGDLARLGAWQDLIDQTKNGATTGEVDIQGVGKIRKADVMHVLVQEMTRIKEWQENPPVEAATDKGDEKAQKVPQWDVFALRLPGENGRDLLVTYGEMNTLADFYGSLDLLLGANPKDLRSTVESVRKEIYLRLRDMFLKLNTSLTDAESDRRSVKQAQKSFMNNDLGMVVDEMGIYDPADVMFPGAVTTEYVSSPMGQLRYLMGTSSTGAKDSAGGGVNEYGAVLARNACHFAPESWHAWAEYHKKARDYAEQSNKYFSGSQEARALIAQKPNERAKLESSARQLEKMSAEFANKALVANGFGDHYLQDSYAAGHLINKTQIMQWYVEYIDTSDEWDYAKDKNWRKVQQMAYTQPGLAASQQYDMTRVEGYGVNPPNKARNPQAVENTGGTWEENFQALGLQVPSSLRTAGTKERVVFDRWQDVAASKIRGRVQTGSDLKKLFSGMGPADLEGAVMNLVKDGVVRTDESLSDRGGYMSGQKAAFDNFAKLKFYLRDDYVPKNTKVLKQQRAEGEAGFQRRAAGVTYNDYLEFMSSAFVQKATNALHNSFCENGLKVLDGAGTYAFMVYGDDNMFNETASDGVKHSGQTANMSRDAILGLINKGTDGGITTKSILDRLPNQVEVDTGNGKVNQSLELWHNPAQGGALKNLCMTDIFPDMSWEFLQKFVPGVIGRSLGNIHEEKPHGGRDLF